MHLTCIPENHNLNYWCLSNYHDLPVQYTHDQPLVKQYLDKLWSLIEQYKNRYPRVLAIRVDLHCFEPSPYLMTSNNVMQNFRDALVSRINAYQRRRRSQGKRCFECPVKMVWAREQKSSRVPHFHLLILLNHDLFYSLGNFQSGQGSLLAIIKGAWNSALKIPQEVDLGLVHVPKNAEYRLKQNDQWRQLPDLFFRASYLCKVDTKCFGQGIQSFGCSSIQRS